MARRNRPKKRRRQRPSKSQGSRPGGRRHGLDEDNVGFGFSACHLLLAEVESVEEFERFRESLVRDLAPEGAMQHMLVDRIVGNLWRLRWVAMLEQSEMDANLGSRHRSMAHLAANLLEIATNRGESIPLEPAHNKYEQGLREMVRHHNDNCFPHQKGWSFLMRYEAHLRKGIYQALGELRRLQADRGAGTRRKVDFG